MEILINYQIFKIMTNFIQVIDLKLGNKHDYQQTSESLIYI